MLVVIGTNVLISYFIRYRSTVGQAVDVILERHTPLYSAETLHEFVAKISSPKFAPYVSPTTIRTFVERYAALGRVVVEVDLSWLPETQRTTSSCHWRLPATQNALSAATRTC